MVYRDHWALGQWYRHYGALVGVDHLYIFAHGADAQISAICPGANVVTIPRDDLNGFDRVRGRMLNSFQAGLLELYDWVIRTDADELICSEPGLSFHDILAAQTVPALFALGLNVVELPGDAPLENERVFARRRHAVFAGHYSKAFAVREPVSLMRHGVQLKPRRVPHFPFEMPRGLYLAHLKFANRPALDEANQHRMEIANRDGKGLPGPAWQNAEDEAAEYIARVEAMPFKPWDEGSDRAYEKLAFSPVRDQEERLVRARTLRFRFRTRLPEGFGGV